MAAYDSLKSLVQQAIRTNGNNEITGQVLQNVLMAMIDELGGENGYAGVATPSTNPGTPDGKVFYFATEAGTYTHFDGATLAKGIHLLVFNGVTWSHQTLYTIDSEVTSGSNNLITSGAVYTKIINAINALNATVSKSAGADGLSLSLTEVGGKVTNISGSIKPQTYDAYGAASAAQIAAATDATNKVNAAKTQILGDAASDYNTLGKLEDKIQAEASRAAAAENALNTEKANKATTLAGYGINDAYTKTEVNGLVSTPHQNYVTVPTYASLPATGSADTIYRVSNYNGSTSQVDASVYSEYAWNGSGYTFLRVDSQIGEVFDITVYNSNTKYADLSAALGTNGANVPSSIRRGGMSVKFVQSSDNKYVQYRCMAQNFTTDVTQWQGVDDELKAGSKNLTESGDIVDYALNINAELTKEFETLNLSIERGTEITSTTIARSYMSASGVITTVGNDNMYCLVYQLSKGNSVLIEGSQDVDDAFVTAAVFNSTPAKSSKADLILNYGGNIKKVFTPPCDCYLVTWRRDTSHIIKAYQYVYSKSEDKKDVGLRMDFVNDFQSIFKDGANVSFDKGSEITENGILEHSYINAGGKIVTLGDTSALKIRYYEIHIGDVVCVNGNTNSYTFPKIGLVTSVPATGSECLYFGDSTDKQNNLFISPIEGYLLLIEQNADYKYKAYQMQYSNNIESSEEVVGGAMLVSDDASYTNGRILKSYMTAAGKIQTVNNANMWCYVYKVSAGDKVCIRGYMAEIEFCCAAFFATKPALNVTASQLISVGEARINTTFIVPNDGWLVTWHRAASNMALVYSLVNKVNVNNSLEGLNICVMGDSIMQLMAEESGSEFTNTVTLKNITDPSDTTVYQESDATVVGGIIYLTSSLTGGQPTANSVRLEIVNSAQSDIDSMTWTKLKNALMAKSVLNCGFGSARIVEKQIVTAYPYISILTEGEETDPWDGETASLPNEVKMMKRCVDEGKFPQPDAVVIWMGVNGAAAVITDTLAEAMQISWDTLSDDTAGYTYRKKFYGAMRYAIEYIYRNFPYTQIFIVSPVQTNRGDLEINNDNPAYRGYTQLTAVANAMKEISNRYACQFIDATHTIGIANFAYRADTTSGGNAVATGTNLGNLCPTFLQDGLHPNNDGKRVLLNFLAKKLSSLFFSKQ